MLLASGRLREQKDFSTLLKAFAQVRQARACRLMILGEGSLRSDLEAEIAVLGLQDDVALPRFCRKPLRLYEGRGAVRPFVTLGRVAHRPGRGDGVRLPGCGNRLSEWPRRDFRKRSAWPARPRRQSGRARTGSFGDPTNPLRRVNSSRPEPPTSRSRMRLPAILNSCPVWLARLKRTHYALKHTARVRPRLTKSARTHRAHAPSTRMIRGLRRNKPKSREG